MAGKRDGNGLAKGVKWDWNGSGRLSNGYQKGWNEA